LNFEYLSEIAKTRKLEYQNASPFPHTVIDHFLNLEFVRTIANEFPVRNAQGAWLDFSGKDARGKVVQANKYHISTEDKLGPMTQRLLYELKSERMLKILETLTGIENLIPDALNLGGGIHMNCNGALLKVHADFNRHSVWHLDRRLNLLLYLNENWQDSYGGHLELWDPEMRACVSKISPIAGRCVIFSTSKTSYHGHPDAMTCPENISRKSVALYYYTNPKQTNAVESHSTLWQDRPNQDE
jgi:Rps23 Pro-64 3,4-dihydroxylase Tpa1-like proline 4-hydroxylase